ncbi:MAG: hypothetical protein F9K24_18005 [Leptonema illini]|uniref:Uncharacterized protein n=1 Tax=Leptonema illini TaxID=183 RepID=A0A833GZU5_9LEPT|nr:MAG: hypothetical protein F9K24_18005 [Leptonema illini]
MKHNIEFDNRIWGSAIFDRIAINTGLGFSRITGNLEIFTNQNEGPDFIEWMQLRCQWQARGRNGKEVLLGTGQLWPDRFSSKKEVSISNIQVMLDLDYSRMAALEQLRDGHDIYFKLHLDGWARRGRHANPEEFRLDCQSHVPLSEWLKRLDESGYKKTLLLEIPVPDVQKDEALSRAAGHLEMAQRHLLNGHYRDCVGACRDVVSAIDFIEFSADKDRDLRGVTEGIQRKASDLRSKDERIYLLRNSFKQIAHAARHDDRLPAENESSEGRGNALPFSWEPEDARLAFSIAAALYRYSYEMKGGRNGG